MEQFYSNFHNLFSVAKTLRFELKPIGKTQEFFEQLILNSDEEKSETFKKIKKYCDEFHKFFIEECLENVYDDKFIDLLKNYNELYHNNSKTEKEDDEFENIKKNLRKIIATRFTKNEKYKGLFGKDFIKKYLKEHYAENDEILKEITLFEDFTTYFTGYNQNRANMYSDEEKHTAIAFRLIDENLPTYIKNIKAFELAINNIQNLSEQIKNLSPFFHDFLTDRRKYKKNCTN